MALEREEQWALWKLANGKAPVMDDIPIEVLNAAGEIQSGYLKQYIMCILLTWTCVVCLHV